MFWSNHEVRIIAGMLNEAGIEHDLDSDAYRDISLSVRRQRRRHISAA